VNTANEANPEQSQQGLTALVAQARAVIAH
jgi:hypothetical protein